MCVRFAATFYASFAIGLLPRTFGAEATIGTNIIRNQTKLGLIGDVRSNLRGGSIRTHRNIMGNAKSSLSRTAETATDDGSVTAASPSYVMPHENDKHEGTWLQWPHAYEYGTAYRDPLEPTWVAMTKALYKTEKVHIIVYDSKVQTRATSLLKKTGITVPNANINFYTYPTNDIWVRDNGPLFVRDTKTKKLTIEDWGFNGYGKKYKFAKSNAIPTKIGTTLKVPVVNLNSVMVLELGAIEIDGKGTFMATKSSTLNKNRNPGLTQTAAEGIMKQYLGITNFIWLDGVAGLDITDMHIDGFVKFVDDMTIVTMGTNDLLEWEIPDKDIQTLYSAKNANGEAYKFIYLPLTKKNVVTTYGKKLGYKGSYVNYYVANERVLVPSYADENDTVAKAILEKVYPGRTVVLIDSRNVYREGGMIHCVTQQQPA